MKINLSAITSKFRRGNKGDAFAMPARKPSRGNGGGRLRRLVEAVRNFRLPKRGNSTPPDKPDAGTRLVGTLAELRAVVTNPPPTNTRIILTGELVLVSESAHAIDPKNYFRQPDRLITALFGTQKSKGSLTLKVWTHEHVLPAIKQLSKHKVYLAADQYLQYGRQHRNVECLVTGYSTDRNTIITLYTFKNGLLTSTEEHNLSSTTTHLFRAEYHQLIEGLARNVRSLVVAAPLPASDVPGVSRVGSDKLYKRLAYLPVTDGSAGQRLNTRLLPMAIAGGAAAVYVAAILLPYNDYESAQAEFRRISADLPKNTSFGASQLHVMQQRRFALKEPRRQESAAALLLRLAQAAAQQKATISNVTLNFADMSKENNPVRALSFTLQVPKQPGAPMDVARPLLDRLSAALKLRLYIASSGVRTETKDGQPSFHFTIEADLPGSAAAGQATAS